MSVQLTTGTGTVIADGATQDLPAGSGLVVLSNNSTGVVALYLIGGGATPTLVSQSAGSSSFVVGAPSAGHVGLEYTGAAYRVSNALGVSVTIGFSGTRTRTGL